MLPGPDSEPEDLDQALSSVARAIADSLELKEVWGRVADACRAVVPFDGMGISRFETPDRIRLPSHEDADLRDAVHEKLESHLFESSDELGVEVLSVSGSSSERMRQVQDRTRR